MAHSYSLHDASNVASPALLFYPALIAQNIAKTLTLAGSPGRLRPHAKTHKTQEIIQLQIAAGVTKHKVATLAEAQMVATAGAVDVLVGYPMVGPNVARLVQLARAFPRVQFASLVDCRTHAEGLSYAARAASLTIGCLVDLDLGMGRTGLALGAAQEFYAFVARQANLRLEGLHAYDGHNNMPEQAARNDAVNAMFPQVLALRTALEAKGHAVPRIVAGGTPTFTMYANHPEVAGLECSPGTLALSDQNTTNRYPEFGGITPAAVVLTRVVSRPRPNRVTLDLGHKSIASEQPLQNRIDLLGVPPYQVVLHSEEHLVIESLDADQFQVGDVVYGLPGHVCPTVALYEEALTVTETPAGQAVTGRWTIAARGRSLKP